MLRKKLKLDSKSDAVQQTTEADQMESHSQNNTSASCTTSKYFSSHESHVTANPRPAVPSATLIAAPSNIALRLLQISADLSDALAQLRFQPPIAFVYDPTVYARATYEAFTTRFCATTKRVLFLGMNPGPFGMCQTGVPFGNVRHVRDWLGIRGPVGRPLVQCPERPILGFDFHRSEVSGDRLWGFFSNLCGAPEHLFRHAFFLNYCPIAMMREGGANLTPAAPDVKKQLIELEKLCDKALIDILELLQVEIVIAIGNYVQNKMVRLQKSHEQLRHIRVHYLLHPSPMNPKANDWATHARDSLSKNGLLQFFQPPSAMTNSGNTVDSTSSIDTEDLNRTEFDDVERKFMDIAFEYAHEALLNQEVPVGCIFVFNDEIIAKGRNEVNETRNATLHAEMVCFDQIEDYSSERGLIIGDVLGACTVYVTVEPCIMCAGAIYTNKIKKVVFGCKNDRFGGQTVVDVCGALQALTTVKGGYRDDDAMALLKQFYKGTNPNAPTSKVKVKSSNM